MSLSPRYTDYKNANDAIKAYKAGKDFTLNDISSKWNNMACSIRDFPNDSVTIRYDNNRKVCVYNPC